MKKKILSFFILIAIITLSLSTAPNVDAVKKVKGYTTKKGTYVAPHYRSSSNGTKLDNYSTKGNYNPYTGKKGTVDPYKYNPKKYK